MYISRVLSRNEPGARNIRNWHGNANIMYEYDDISRHQSSGILIHLHPLHTFFTIYREYTLAHESIEHLA